MALSKYQQAASGFMPITSAGRGRGRDPEFKGDTRLNPVASPTDQFVRVGPTPRSPLFDLASSLSEFEGSLQGLVADRMKEENDAEALRAEKQFIENNEENFAEAVRTGRIPAYASPSFVKSYKAAEGRKVARNLTSNIVQSYETWDGREADDASGYAPWVAAQVKQGLEGIEDPDILRSALPGVRSLTERLGAQHAQNIGERVMDRAVEGIGKDIIGAIDNATGEPVLGPDGPLVTYEGLSDAITASLAEGRKIGIPEERLKKVAVEAVVAKAVRARDYDLLKALPEDVAKSPYASKLIEEAHDKIGTLLYQDETRADRRAKTEEKLAVTEATSGVIDLLTRDIDAEIPEDILQRGEQGDPAFRIKAEELRGKLRTNNSAVSPEIEIDASVRIHTAEDPVAQAIAEIEAGNIGNPSRANSILLTAQRLKQSKDRGVKSIIASPAVKQYEKALRDRFSTPDIISNKDVVDERAYGSALVDYHIALTEWEEANPEASTIDRMKAAREIGEEMLKTPTAPAAKQRAAAPAPSQPQPTAPAEKASTTETPAEGEPAQRDPLLDAVRKANPALKNVPDEVIRKYLPKGGAPGKQSEAETGDEAEVDLASLTEGEVTPEMSNRRIRAAVRANNPGAMWFAPWQSKYGVLGRQNLRDGKGQGNNIALFPTKEAGGAAQFELLNRQYSGMTLAAAVKRWSGGNSWAPYAVKLARTLGVPLNTPLSIVLEDRDLATLFAKTSAAHEAGLTSYPMSDEQWASAYDLYLEKNGMSPVASSSTTQDKEG
jgi:hypothetical protein